MKRNFYFILFVLFILSACTGSGNLMQSATAAQADHSAWITFPAPIPTEEGKTVEINSSNYPTNPDNFILDDTRTNEEKMDILVSLAKEDVEKEIELYKEEIKRMGKKESDFEFLASIVDGRSWVIVPREKAGGKVYVPSIDGIIQSSLHLFGRLGEKGDFFDLIPVAIENATVVGDSSGWHVVAGVKEGRVSKWYDARYDRVETIVEPTPTPDMRFTELLPKTLEECRENNILRLDHLEEDLAFLVEKEKESITDTSFIPDSGMAASILDTSIYNSPTDVSINIYIRDESTEKIIFSSCSYIKEKGIDVIGIPIKSVGGEIVGFLHFPIDSVASRYFFNQLGYDEQYEKYNDLEKNYAAYFNNKIKYLSTNIILQRGDAEKGGIWDNLLSVGPKEINNPLKNNLYVHKLDLLIGAQSHRLGDRVLRWEYGEEKLMRELEQILIPVTSLGIINFN